MGLKGAGIEFERVLVRGEEKMGVRRRTEAGGGEGEEEEQRVRRRRMIRRG